MLDNKSTTTINAVVNESLNIGFNRNLDQTFRLEIDPDQPLPQQKFEKLASRKKIRLEQNFGFEKSDQVGMTFGVCHPMFLFLSHSFTHTHRHTHTPHALPSHLLQQSQNLALYLAQSQQQRLQLSRVFPVVTQLCEKQKFPGSSYFSISCCFRSD